MEIRSSFPDMEEASSLLEYQVAKTGQYIKKLVAFAILCSTKTLIGMKKEDNKS